MALTTFAAPPITKRTQHTDNLHGTNVLDPYRWLESDTPDVNAWVKAQGDYTRGMLDSLPSRDSIRKRLVELNNYTRSGSLVKRSGLPRLTSHGLRHTAATHMVRQAADVGELRAVADVLGHSPDMLPKTYAHVLPDSMAAVAERIGSRQRRSDRRQLGAVQTAAETCSTTYKMGFGAIVALLGSRTP